MEIDAIIDDPNLPRGLGTYRVQIYEHLFLMEALAYISGSIVFYAASIHYSIKAQKAFEKDEKSYVGHIFISSVFRLGAVVSFLGTARVLSKLILDLVYLLLAQLYRF